MNTLIRQVVSAHMYASYSSIHILIALLPRTLTRFVSTLSQTQLIVNCIFESTHLQSSSTIMAASEEQTNSTNMSATEMTQTKGQHSIYKPIRARKSFVWDHYNKKRSRCVHIRLQCSQL